MIEWIGTHPYKRESERDYLERLGLLTPPEANETHQGEQ